MAPPKAKRHNSSILGSAGRLTARKIAAGAAAMAKRSAPSSSGSKAARPARMAGKAEAQPTTVRATAMTAVVSIRCVEFNVPV
ncbi:hypothetical protein AJ88_39595 [Mesorhizobium amorphae CCBAU 01583]|nr:hypothetical protein AJ88_39595 [Mesorhizobium amorphae CCBAU 01583]